MTTPQLPVPASADGFTVEPEQLLATRDVFLSAANRVDRLVLRCQAELYVDPAMGDPFSERLAVSINRHHREGPQSILGALTAYRDELRHVATTLDAVHADYLRVDADIAARLS